MGIKEGDKLIIEVGAIADLKWGIRYIKDIPGCFSDKNLEKLEKYNETEAYKNGLHDAWELVRKMSTDMSINELSEVFGYISDDCETCEVCDLVERFTATEAIEKIKAYEEKKAKEQEIRVGDEVRHKEHRDLKIIVTAIVARTSTIHGMNNEGFPIISNNIEKWEKTGKHYDEIEKLFGKSGEDNDKKISF